MHCFVKSGRHSLRDRTKGEIRYKACNFSDHTGTDTQRLANIEKGILTAGIFILSNLIKLRTMRFITHQLYKADGIREH